MLNLLGFIFRETFPAFRGVGSARKGKVVRDPGDSQPENSFSFFSPSSKKETLDFIEEATTEFDQDVKSY